MKTTEESVIQCDCGALVVGEGMARWLSESESYLIEEVSTNFLLKSREGESTLADDRSEDISTLQNLQK